MSDQVFELLRRQVPSAQLVLADPGDSCVPVGKILLIGDELNLWVLMKDTIAVVTVHDGANPDIERVDDHAVRQDVFLELFQLFLPKRWNLALKLGVNG